MISLGILTDLQHHAQQFYCRVFWHVPIISTSFSSWIFFHHCITEPWPLMLSFHTHSFRSSVFEPFFHLKALHQTHSNLYACLGQSLPKKWFEWFLFVFFLVMLRNTKRHNSLLLFPYLHSCFVKVHCQAYPEKCLMSGYLNAHEDTKWKQKSCSDLLWAFVTGNYTNHIPQQDTFCFGGDWRQVTVLLLAVLTSLFHRHSGVFDLVLISIPFQPLVWGPVVGCVYEKELDGLKDLIKFYWKQKDEFMFFCGPW